eukprot:TRINITY_DN3977_c0_g1_i2.p1 TRINITY_DN3977_c0_g1~~TRINITY_DN3977_c0_g1_i2.p1  ORF type:complete len:330 (-),score=64.84 TRINITY_DN3977_c0_g1_i2:35-1024(-)
MAAQAKVIINTAGPFTFYGPQVVKAAIKQGSHYIDSTGEPNYVVDMYKLHDIARQKKVWIVPACGFDSIPADITTYAAMTMLTPEEKAHGTVTSRCYATFGGLPSGGTFSTFVELAGRSSDPKNKETMRQLRGRFHKFHPQGWAIPMPSSDPFVANRTAELLKLPSGGKVVANPSHYPTSVKPEVYIIIPSLFSLLKMGIVMFFVFLLAQFALGKKLLRWFLPPGTGPDAITRRRSYFNTTCEAQVTLNGKTRTVTTVLRGGDPGYTETSKMLSECGLALALDQVKEFDSERPKAAGEVGGVVSPAAAFGHVLIRRLQAAGLLISKYTN